MLYGVYTEPNIRIFCQSKTQAILYKFLDPYQKKVVILVLDHVGKRGTYVCSVQLNHLILDFGYCLVWSTD